ncbi:MAG: hypothetical protein HOD28_01630 [Candidatus Marinimicrobia bacterium]|jgi:hypothetical protein|nr:hypothetical protein [Candidatus Neomarinimicrobiota bacterium]
MAQQHTKLSDKDFKLLKKEGVSVLGENGPLHPTFGNDVQDFVKFHVYDLNDTYLKSGISEDFNNADDTIQLKPGNDLRKVGFTRGDYKVKYFFYRRMAGADEAVLTKTGGEIHSGNPQLTGLPMGEFYVGEDGKVFQGEKPPVNGQPSELDIKEYKFFIDEVSADRKEVRLAPQMINLDKYRDEFSSLSDEYGIYTSIKEISFGSVGGGLQGLGKFNGINNTGFQIDNKANGDPGFKHKYVGGTLEVENAFIVGYTEHTSTNKNDDWSLEDPIPEADLRAYVIGPPEWTEWLGTNVIYSVSNKIGSALAPQDAVPNIYDPEDYVNLFGDLLAAWNEMSNNDTTNATGWWAHIHQVTDKASFGEKHWDENGKNESGRRKRLYSHRNGVKYYWDFGCGHTEITDIPVATHTYDVGPADINHFTPSVTIMTPNFTYTPDTLLDRQDRTLNKVTVGTIPIPTHAQDPTPDSPFDGRLVKNDGGTIWYIQSGHKRYVGNWDIVWPLSVITGQYVQEQTVYNAVSDAYETNAAYVNFGLPIVAEISDAIPDGPDITLTGQNGITNPNTLDLPIIDGSFDD